MNNDRVAKIEGKKLALHWLRNALSMVDITLEYLDTASTRRRRYFHD